MQTQLTTYDNRLSKLENTLSTLRSSMWTVQATNSEKGVEQKRISSVVHQHEGLVRDLNYHHSNITFYHHIYDYHLTSINNIYNYNYHHFSNNFYHNIYDYD